MDAITPRWLLVLKTLLDPGVIAATTLKVSYLMAPLSGILLLLAIYFRIVDTQLASLGSFGKWGAAIKSIAMWSFALGAYYAINASIVGFFNEIFQWLHGVLGSADGIVADLARMTSYIQAKSATQEQMSVFSLDYWKTLGQTISAAPLFIIGLFFWYLTNIALMTILGILKLGYVIIFSGVFLLGFIVLPIAITQKLSFFRGWAMVYGALLLWPIVDAMVMGLLQLPIHAATEKLLQDSTAAATVDGADLIVIRTVMNIIIIVFAVVALWITKVLVTNHGTVHEASMPIINVIKRIGRR